MCENEWRAEYCPEYGLAYCECPFEIVTCPGAWECDDVQNITEDVLAYYDTDLNDSINPADAIDDEHYGVMIEYCDTNNDGSIDSCEIHTCVLLVENNWRDENCPGYGYLVCDCPYSPPPCEGAWNCDDIIFIT